MESIAYDIAAAVAAARQPGLAGPVEAATVALARLDERLARCDPSLAGGFAARTHFFEAQAIVALAGGLAALEDLVLHDASMDVRAAEPEVIRAAWLVQLRRSLARRDPGEVLATGSLRALLDIPEKQGGAAAATDAAANQTTGGTPLTHRATSISVTPWDMPRFGGGADSDDEAREDDSGDTEDPERRDFEPLDPGDAPQDRPDAGGAGSFAELDALVARSRRSLAAYNDLQSGLGRAHIAFSDPAYDQPGRLDAWLRIITVTADLPAALAAAIGLDAWLTLEPSEHQGELGFLLTAALLRQRGLAAAHLPALAIGLRASRPRWQPAQVPAARLAGLLAAMTETARAGHADLDRLTLARAVMLRKCAGKSKSSRLRDLIDLFTASPLVSMRMAAKTLKITPQGVTVLLENLGAARPREITGRKRYRAWGIL